MLCRGLRVGVVTARCTSSIEAASAAITLSMDEVENNAVVTAIALPIANGLAVVLAPRIMLLHVAILSYA